MEWSGKRRVPFFLLVAIVLAFPGVQSWASKIYRHRQHGLVRCGLALHPYREVVPTFSASTIATVPVYQTVETAVAGSRQGEGQEAGSVRRKDFFAKRPSLTVEHIQLSRISLAVLKSGQLQCSGLFSHNGGPQGAIRSSQVTVRLRFFAGTPQQTSLRQGAPLLAETTKSVRVFRGEAAVISLLPDEISRPGLPPQPAHAPATPPTRLKEQMAKHFNSVTHMEVVLEYRPDR